MRKTLVCLISCLSSLALALAQDENSPDTAPAEKLPANDPAPGEEGNEAEEASPEEEELAALEEAARKAAEEEQLRLAKAAAAREAAVGEKHASLTTGKGRSYKKVVIKGVDEVGVKITHEYGTARIKFEELPEEFQARFGYDPSRAQELLAREKDLESARARASIAALRANAGLPPRATTGPKTTRPKTTRPKTTKPKTTRPKTTRPADSSPSLPSDNVEVQAMVARIAELEQGVAKLRPAAEKLDDKAKDLQDQAFKGIGGTGGDPKVSQKKLAEAKSWEAKAEAVYNEINTARSEISQLKRKIKRIELSSKKEK
ncbi:MAG: hypothetical protein MK194_16985 [Roseibacillus sp.]|nr:hypothetical protein [Roseibacillus sp.]